MKGCADELGLPARDGGFVPQRIVERQRVGADRPAHPPLRKTEHGAGIDAAAQIAADLHIGDQALADGLGQDIAESLDDLGLGALVRRSTSAVGKFQSQ